MQLSPEEQYYLRCAPPHLYSRAPSVPVHVVWSQLTAQDFIAFFFYVYGCFVCCMYAWGHGGPEEGTVSPGNRMTVVRHHAGVGTLTQVPWESSQCS